MAVPAPLFTERTLPDVVLDDREGASWLALPVGLLRTPAPTTAGGVPPERPTAPGASRGALPAATRAALERLQLDLADIARDTRFTGAAGSVLAFPVAPGVLSGTRRVLLVGTGDGSRTDLRRAGAALARTCTGMEAVATFALADADDDLTAAFVTGFLLGAYQPPASGTKTRPGPVGTLVLLGLAPRASALETIEAARSAARATWLARDLAGTSSAIKNPPWLARAAADLAQPAGLSVKTWTERELAAEGFGGLLAVGAGSSTPPRLVTVGYEPRGRQADPGEQDKQGKHVVLVGKGITFDTGGLSIKPAEAMVPMRTDMTGAAVVLATVLAAARRGVPHRVTAVLALAENAVGANAYRPGDVVTTWDGTTVEIANTDAEGRIVLADALAWAGAILKPDVMIDVATLTGAATLGLGRGHGALYSGDDTLAGELVAAGQRAGERLWRMPLVADYDPAIRSELADLSQVPATKEFGGGGSITAALFLQEFSRGANAWAHLDIAGPARAGADSHEISKGPTGFGARVLLDWLAG